MAEPDHQYNQTVKVIEKLYLKYSRQVFATLIRLLGDFDLAEEALQEAFKVALEQWPKQGVPDNPRAWLVSAGRFKGIDLIRKRQRFADLPEEIAEQLADENANGFDEDSIEDDRLRLIFICCHPALSQEVQIALTLREVCGLTTEAIASAFLVAPTTLAQRIVRAKTKIRDARIPYQVPTPEMLPERLDSVLHVIYLIFNEGYFASSGATLTRPDLAEEAIRLGRLLTSLLPNADVIGLLALMLLQESRHGARMSPTGDIILLEDQDRSLWDRDLIQEGSALVEQALASGQYGFFTLQAAIAAVHANAANAEATNWSDIALCYDLLLGINSSPIIELNRAAAIAMRDGPAAGLALVDALLARGELVDYHLAHSARADLLRRLGQKIEAKSAYTTALKLAQLEPERRFLERRLKDLAE